MRKVSTGIAALLVAGIYNSPAETIITAQDYAVDSDVVLESAVREIKSIPTDTANVVGDAVKYVSDETVTAAKGVAAAFKSDPSEKAEKAGMIEVAKAWNSASDILFRSYAISESVGEELTQGIDAPEGEPVNVSEFFSGMEFPKGTSAVYRPEFNKLFVRQTQENMLMIEDMLAEQHSAQRDLMGKQVEIETKFVEVSQSTLNELGFSWNFAGKGGLGNAANVFENLTLPAQDILSDALRTGSTAMETGISPAGLSVIKNQGSFLWGLYIQALEQADDTDVLSAPRIVTRDGNTATIQVGEERMVPKSFGVTSANTSIYVEHSDWDSELMGVQLEVTPELRSEDLIDLELRPKVIDLLGYDSYQISPDNATMVVWAGGNVSSVGLNGRFPIITKTVDGTASVIGDLFNAVVSEAGGNLTGATNVNATADSGQNPRYYSSDRMPRHDTDGLAVPTLRGELPYFRLREMETRVTVADGSTVGMGGLIYDKLETYRDKVPVLGSIPFVGRLFRSEGEKSVKRNLMIFVTATQVDVNGRRASDLAMKR